MPALLFAFIIFLMPFSAMAQIANTEIAELRKFVTESRQRENIINQKLANLETEINQTEANIEQYRYQATQIYHALNHAKLKGSTLSPLMQRQSFLESYIDQHTYRDMQKAMGYHMQRQAAFLKTLQTQNNDITHYREQRILLNREINQAMVMLQNNQSHNEDISNRILLLKDKAESLEAFLSTLIDINIPVSEIKTIKDDGFFIMPASGQVNIQNNTMTIETRASAPVLSPAPGIVLYAGEFHPLGNIMIIRHADNHLTLLRNVGAITAQQGQKVNKSQMIASMPQNKKRDKDIIAPMLYYELRYNDSIINPFDKMKDF